MSFAPRRKPEITHSMDAVAKTVILDDFRGTVEHDYNDTSHIESHCMWYELIHHNQMLLGYNDTICSLPIMTL